MKIKIGAFLSLWSGTANWEFLHSITGGFSQPSKMPCFSWSIPAEFCLVGSKLRALAKMRGISTVCGSCYALKGRYVFPNVRKALARRLKAFNRDSAYWTAGIIVSLRKLHASRAKTVRKRARYFRWFDSGDLQSIDMLQSIVDIARAVPETRFWIPTRERSIVAEWIRKNGALPENINIRLSASMIGEVPGAPIEGCTSSAVGIDASPVDVFLCRAPSQGGQCLACRACWDLTIPVVAYKKH